MSHGIWGLLRRFDCKSRNNSMSKMQELTRLMPAKKRHKSCYQQNWRTHDCSFPVETCTVSSHSGINVTNCLKSLRVTRMTSVTKWHRRNTKANWSESCNSTPQMSCITRLPCVYVQKRWHNGFLFDACQILKRFDKRPLQTFPTSFVIASKW